MAAAPDALQFFLEEVRHEDQAVRLNAIRRTALIAHAIGSDRTVGQLLPLLHDISKEELYLNDDEFLFRLAEQYAVLLDYTGGQYSFLVPQVEWLAYQEETVIRDKAVHVLCLLCHKVDVATDILPPLKRLAQAEWFTARLSVCALFPSAYPFLKDDGQRQTLRQLYANLAGDETPMVRRAAALGLKDFFAVVEKSVIGAELLGVYRQLAADDTQDIIRVACVLTTLVLIENHFKDAPEENKAHTLLVLTNACEDRSWRVRLTLTQNFDRVVAALGPDLTASFLLNPFVQLLKDSEQEVRSAAVFVVGKVLAHLTSEQVQTFIVPQFQALSTDSSQPVRTALASVIVQTAKELGREATHRLLLPPISDLLKDEHHEVRLQIVSHAAEVCLILGIEVMAHSLLATIQGLVMDNQWRIRKSVLEQIPEMAKQFGPEMFQSKLEAIFFNSLGDSVHAVRFAAVENVGIISSHFGPEWTTSHFLKKVTEQYQASAGFSTRITILHALPQLSQSMKPEQVQTMLAPVLIKGLTDPVPNVRYCAARLAPELCTRLPDAYVTGTIKVALEGLTGDSDADVGYLAAASAERLKEIAVGN